MFYTDDLAKFICDDPLSCLYLLSLGDNLGDLDGLFRLFFLEFYTELFIDLPPSYILIAYLDGMFGDMLAPDSNLNNGGIFGFYVLMFLLTLTYDIFCDNLYDIFY